MSPTFRALRNPNYRLYLAGSVVSNTGTWMQRVAQDWLVLSLPGTGGTELGITTGLQFLPMLLLSPYAGVVADRFPKRALLQITQSSMALSSLVLGLLAVTGHAQVWHVYVLAFAFGIGAAFDAPARQSFVSEMVGRDDLHQRRRPQQRDVQRRPHRRPGAGRLPHRALGGGAEASGWVILINAVSYLAVFSQLCADATPGCCTRPSRAAAARGAARGRALRPLPAQDADDPGAGVLRRHVRDELPDDLGADGDRGLRQGRRRVRPPRLDHGRRLAGRRAARRPAAPRVRMRLLVGAAIVFGLVEIVVGLMPTLPRVRAASRPSRAVHHDAADAANATMQIAVGSPHLRGRVMALYMTVVMGGTPLGAPVIGWIGETSAPAGR